MVRSLYKIALQIFIIAVLVTINASFLAAQGNLVEISLNPDETDWDWQDYQSRVADKLSSLIDNTVRDGLDRREFELSETTFTLDFNIRIDEKGKPVSLTRTVPEKRYLTYLIERTIYENNIFPPLPDDFPVFYLTGVMSVKCRFKPTGRYKRLYFEEPLDSLRDIDSNKILKPVKFEPLYLYEPEGVEKNVILEKYRNRLGLGDPIADTSAYTPVSFMDVALAVHVPYDSLFQSSPYDIELIETKIEAALRDSGAVIRSEEYEVVEKPEKKNATIEAAMSDTLAENDSTMADVTEPEEVAEPIDSSKIVITGAMGARIPEKMSLAEAFSTVYTPTYLVLSAGFAPGDSVNRGLCRIQMFKSDKPEELKKNIRLQFKHKGYLPDDIGKLIVQRLVAPPAKPAPPPPPPKPAAPAIKADSTAAVKDSTEPAVTAVGAETDSLATAADSTAADSAVAVPVTADSLSGAITESTSTAVATDSTAAADSTSVIPAPADSLSGAEASPDSENIAAPADSLQTPTTPADSSNPAPAAPETAVPAPATAEPATPSPADTPTTKTAAEPDSTAAATPTP